MRKCRYESPDVCLVLLGSRALHILSFDSEGNVFIVMLSFFATFFAYILCIINIFNNFDIFRVLV